MKTHKIPSYVLSAIVICAPVIMTAAPLEKRLLTWRSLASTVTVAIGNVESMEPVQINGLQAQRSALVMNGDVIQAPKGATARISLVAGGDILLRNGGAVKVFTSEATHRVNATVINGEVYTALRPDYSAVIALGDSQFVTSKGAKVRAFWKDDAPAIIAVSGTVLDAGRWAVSLKNPIGDAQAQAPRRYLIKPYNLGATTDVRARSTRNIQVRVTDENDKPVPDAPILFLLGGAGGSGPSGVGSFAGQASLKATTNAQGVASANFTATNPGQTTIKAIVEGTDASVEISLTILAARTGFWAPQNSIPIFSVLGAAVGYGLYRYYTRDTTIRGPGKIDIRPNSTGIIP